MVSDVAQPSSFFARQRQQTQKYPFYRLRDEIVWQLATEERPSEDTLMVYNRLTVAIEKLKVFNFRFYSDTVALVLEDVIEESVKSDWDSTKRRAPAPLSPLWAKFIRLILDTARQNSLLLRLAMTRLGYHVLVVANLPRAIMRYRRKHQTIDFSRLETAQKFSVARHEFAAGCRVINSRMSSISHT